MNQTIPVGFIATMAAKRARSFIRGWGEGLLRFRQSKGGQVVTGSSIDPKEDREAFAASQAAVAYMIAMDDKS